MSSQEIYSQFLLPTPVSISKGSVDQSVSLSGNWTISTNCPSDRLKNHVYTLPKKVSTSNPNDQFDFAWNSTFEGQIDEFYNRKNIGVFQPRDPLFLLILPDGLEIKPELIIKNIQWQTDWNINDYCSTDEYHLLIGKFIQISSRTERGLFYGLQSLKSLIKFSKNNIPLQTIQDSPKTSQRTILLSIQTDPINDEFFEDVMHKMASYKINSIILQGGKLTENHFSLLNNLYIEQIQRPEKPLLSSRFSQWAIKNKAWPILIHNFASQAETTWTGKSPSDDFSMKFWQNFFFATSIKENIDEIQNLKPFFDIVGYLKANFEELQQKFQENQNIRSNITIEGMHVEDLQTKLLLLERSLYNLESKVRWNKDYFESFQMLLSYQIILLKTISVIPTIEQIGSSLTEDTEIHLPSINSLSKEQESLQYLKQSLDLLQLRIFKYNEWASGTPNFQSIFQTELNHVKNQAETSITKFSTLIQALRDFISGVK
ncbi:hypothetical protein NEF87_002046 [Candidatus Lokiarchaeum ossiferum]|uniref:Beta-hexosaminidase bacterial type N-terminal domain-containing protein n=1 Tax=Candidatus Lokiarchaeum ossiferum TaxID=2951803 RepID=A0ABY6HQH7_9ARCH|nr:hypothetical protein NEF87_002046 [Candidatus Lokiarchaeum sp. B-35]